MGRRVNSYDYLSKSIRKRDTTGEMLNVMQSIDIALDTVADQVLLTTWDIENAPREELITMAESIGITIENFMGDELIRRYLRSSGRIRELKGTDNLVSYLVDVLTRFKVDSVELSTEKANTVNVRLSYGTPIEFDYEQRLLDYFIEKYKRMIYKYDITYLFVSITEWVNPLTVLPTKTVLRDTIIRLNFEEYTFPQPFNYQALQDLESYSPFWTTTLTTKLRSTTNGNIDGTVDTQQGGVLRHKITVDPVPNITVDTNKKLTQRMSDIVPDLSNVGTFKLIDKVTRDLSGTMFMANFKSPFELVTLY